MSEITKTEAPQPKKRPAKPVAKAPAKKTPASKSKTELVAAEFGVVPNDDEQVNKFVKVLKEEELLSYFVRVQRTNGLSSKDIVAAWTNFKPTVTDDNIDLFIYEYRLRLLVGDNRAQLGYTPNEIRTMIEKALVKTK